MSARADRAVELFEGGCACSQAVLLVFSDELGLEADLGIRIAAPFAAGMRLDSTCGAVTGALMVLGLALCMDGCATREGRAVTAPAIAELAARFEAATGSLACSAILGMDLREPDAMARAMEQGLFATKCAPAVRAVVEILEDLLPPG